MSATGSRKSRRSVRLRRFWPSCLRGSSPDLHEDPAPDGRPAADNNIAVPAAAVPENANTSSDIQSSTGSDNDKMAAVTSQSSGNGDVGLLTIHMTDGGPYGFRLADGDDGQLVVSKLRKRGKADEAGLREGDALMTINGRSCQGLSCNQAMDLIDSAGQTLTVRVNRGSARVSTMTSSSSSSLSSSSVVVERVTSSSVTRSHSTAQDRGGQSVYVSPADPVHVSSSDLFTPTTATTPPSSAIIHRSPRQSHRSPLDGSTTLTGSMTDSTDSGITVTAPPGVEVQHDVSGHTFTLTFGGLMSVAPPEPVSVAHHPGQGQGTAPLIWQPSRPAAEQTRSTSTTSVTHVEETHSVTTHSRPPQLTRILQESKDSDGPETPTSPSARASKKLFIDSAFYDDPEHKYPTAEEQIALARRVAQSVLAPANVNSRGHKMFVKRRERAFRWEAGYTQEDGEDAEAEKDDAAANKLTSPSSLNTTTPLTLTSYVFAPKLPSGETVVDPDKLDAMSSEELERVMLFEKKSTHTIVAPQVCFNLADDLRNMKGKGGRLFAKRQAKSESWSVGGPDDENPSPAVDTADQDSALLTSTVELRLGTQVKSNQPPAAETAPTRCESMPVNRLKEMVEVPRAAMTPWEAAATFGTVDPAFHHLDAAGSVRRENSKTHGSNSGGSRVKSWTGNPEAAAVLFMVFGAVALAAAVTSSSLQSKEKAGYQSVKFVPSTASGTVDS